MTIGSPIDKHIALWPDMWDPLQNPNTTRIPPKERRIAWRNYYDYADPVGFDLDTARAWLKRHGWDRFFEFEKNHDFGFARYFLPGKAHNDYWTDPHVFGHFICDVMGLEPVVDGQHLKRPPAQPQNRPFASVSSYVTPFTLIIAILFTGVYLLFAALNSYLSIREPLYLVVRDVAGVTCLLSGTTACSRILCLTRRLSFKLKAILAFLLGVVGYVIFRTDWVRELERSFPGGYKDSCHCVIAYGFCSRIFGYCRPEQAISATLSADPVNYPRRATIACLGWIGSSELDDPSLS